MKKKILFIFVCLLTIVAHAQTSQLKGTVEDKNGEPLIGATVSIPGTTTAAMTDVDGKFTLTIPSSIKSVRVSYVGYKNQDVDIQGKTELKIVMQEDANVLDDVVVVGYGVQKKATLTGAISTLSGTDLNKRITPSMSTALQGTMPGVTVQQTSGEPGADAASIRIRGIGSINSNTSPLVLVDGMEMDMNQLDMNTVENISVLKDASSASIYGSRASNGVILITTKRGKEGKVKLSYSSYLTIQKPTNMPEVLSAADYLQAELNSLINTESTSYGRMEDLKNEIEHQRKFRPDNWNYYDTDWKEATISKSAVMHSHNVTLAAGSKDFKYFGSLSYIDQGGLIKNNNYNRLNIRVNTDANLFPWLKLGNEISYRDSKRVTPGLSNPKAIINKALYMLPTLSAVRELDGNWGNGKNGDNPTAAAEASGTKVTKSPELLLSTTFTATPIQGLELQAQYSYRKSETRGTNILKPYTTSVKGNVNARYPVPEASVSETWAQNLRNYYRLQASFSKETSGHTFKVMGGFDAEENTYTNFTGSRTKFELDRYYLDNGDRSTSAAEGGANSWSMASFYGRFNYEYADKYLFEFSGRYDGSSRFIRENRWGFFPSASVGWILSNENFMKSISFLNHFKIRGSIGTLGNQDIVGDNYPYTATVNPGWSYWFDKELHGGVAQTTLANRNIKWEKSRQINIGLDTYLFNQKLGVNFDYYEKKMYDMLMRYPLPYYVGLGYPYSNAGDMVNKGWEVALTYREKINEVSLTATATLSNNVNKVTKLYGPFPDNSVREGYAKGGYWGYLTDGYYSDLDDVNNSPKLTSSTKPGYVKYKKLDPDTNPMQIGETDKVYLGDPFPHYEYGLNIVATWRDFDATVFFQGVGKRDVMMSGIGLKPFANGANLFKHQLDSWTPENPNAEYPILVPEANSTDNFVTSDKWVRNGAYLRLKNIVVGYTLPKTLMQKIKLDNARIYASGQNLLTFSSFYKGYDPEVNYGGNLGGEFYPIMQTFTFGLEIKF